MIEIDLTHIPAEVTDYGFDQLPDRMTEEEVEMTTANITAHDQFERDYDQQTFRIHDTILATILRGALYDKIDDIDWEVRHEERDDFDSHATQQMRRGVRSAFDGVLAEVDLSALPDEVTAFGFDQFPDLLTYDRIDEEINTLRAHDQFEWDYDEQTFRMNDNVPASILRGALYEKVDDIAREVQRGERTDYTMSEVERMRRDIREAFMNGVAAEA